MCEFLRVYPYGNRETFERDVVSFWKAGNHDESINRLKRLIQYILLRRTQGVVNLPPRTDLRVTLQFNPHEQEYYSAAEANVASTIDAVINDSGRVATTFASVMQQINELRLICNMGIHRKAKKTSISQTSIWTSQVAQRALVILATTTPLVCNACKLDLDVCATNDELGADLASHASRVELSACLKVLCNSCYSQNQILHCGCTTGCPVASVLYTPGSMYSGAMSPTSPTNSTNAMDEIPLPTKVKSLVVDLLEQPRGTKR
jgi:SNF2 family DNA or RNA helicase